MKALPENIIEEQILTFLNFKMRIFAWKKPTSGYFDVRRGAFRKQVSKFAINGVSDINGVYLGRPLYIEVKTPEKYAYIQKHYEELKNYFGDNKEKNRFKNQIEFIERIKAEGGIAFFADSVDCTERELDGEVNG